MKRKDMVPHTELYAIEVRPGSNVRPGIILDPGQPPAKVRVKLWWRWTTRWVNEAEGVEDPIPEDLTAHGLAQDANARVDNAVPTNAVATNQVIMPWADYCRERKADAERKHQARLAQEAAEAIEQTEWEARVDAALDGVTYHEIDWLRSALKRKSIGLNYNDVIRLVEAVRDTKPGVESKLIDGTWYWRYLDA